MAARKVIEGTQRLLWGRVGVQALHYLHRRGLSDETIWQAQLGYLPGYVWEWRQVGALNVPCGIVIPWIIDDEVWAVKVRRAAGLPKYMQVAGGSAHGLYNATHLGDHAVVLLVEGEFDALLAAQESGGQMGVATLGSASTTLNARWLSMLIHCRKLLVCYDADEAGQKGAARLQAMTDRAQIVRLPWGKDITEFVMQGGSVAQWLNATL